MDKLLQKLKTDWEIALFWAVLVALVGTLAVWLTASGNSQEAPPKGSAKPRQSILGDNAFDFLESANVPKLAENPFSFGYKAEQKRPWRTPANVTAPAATPNTRPATGTAAVATPTPTPTPPAPVAPAAPKPARVLTYRGYMQTASGQMVAFMTVTDPATKKSTMEQLSVGRKVDGIEIKEFTPETLEVLGPKGDARTIPKGGRKKIELE